MEETVLPGGFGTGGLGTGRPGAPEGFPAPLNPAVEMLESSKIAEVWALGFGVEKLIPLWVGESDLPTPDFICDAATQALNQGHTFYPPKRGLPELRQAIADYNGDLYGVGIDIERVSVFPSAMQAAMETMQALARPDDEVVIVTPLWPNILQAARTVGAKVVTVDLDSDPDAGFHLDLEKLFAAVTERTCAIYIATPGNPTGWLMESEAQRQVLDFCRRRGIWMVADEVYARFTYDRPHAPSFLELARADDPLIVINSFSKAWAMTGWRLGWVVHPPAFGPIYDKLIEFSVSGAPGFLQHGALAAIRDGEPFVRDMVERCRRGGELVFQRLQAFPRVSVARPRAAFYLFFKVEGMTDSVAFAKQILAETGVGLAPGVAFGASGNDRLRLCFFNSEARLSEAMDRMTPLLS